jgi:hypothetical protein
MGLNYLIFCMNVLELAFRGILCWMMSMSNVFKSSYDHAKISAKNFMSMTYMYFYFGGSSLDNLTILGFSVVPMLQSITSSS